MLQTRSPIQIWRLKNLHGGEAERSSTPLEDVTIGPTPLSIRYTHIARLR